MYKMISHSAEFVARTMALVGGLVLIVLVIMSCISIAGRTLSFTGLGPITGDYEWIEMGMAFAIFSFMPLCQLQRGHATVDLFKNAYPAAMNRLVDFLVDIGFFATAAIITWRLYDGMTDKVRYQETTFILNFPVWQGYLAAFVASCAFVLVAAYCVLRSGWELVHREPQDGGSAEGDVHATVSQGSEQ